jgi:hypothetical protein
MKLRDFIKNGIVIHCELEEEAIKLMELADKEGYTWRFGGRYTCTNHNWRYARGNTCYNLFSGQYADIDYYTGRGFEILKFSSLFNFNIKYISKSTIQYEYNKFC